MKVKRIVIGALLGAATATVLAWGGLYLFATLILHGSGSLFDTNPSAANAFFAGWLTLTAIATLVGGFIGQIDSKSRTRD